MTDSEVQTSHSKETKTAKHRITNLIKITLGLFVYSK